MQGGLRRCWFAILIGFALSGPGRAQDVPVFARPSQCADLDGKTLDGPVPRQIIAIPVDDPAFLDGLTEAFFSERSLERSRPVWRERIGEDEACVLVEFDGFTIEGERLWAVRDSALPALLAGSEVSFQFSPDVEPLDIEATSLANGLRVSGTDAGGGHPQMIALADATLTPARVSEALTRLGALDPNMALASGQYFSQEVRQLLTGPRSRALTPRNLATETEASATLQDDGLVTVKVRIPVRAGQLFGTPVLDQSFAADSRCFIQAWVEDQEGVFPDARTERATDPDGWPEPGATLLIMTYDGLEQEVLARDGRDALELTGALRSVQGGFANFEYRMEISRVWGRSAGPFHFLFNFPGLRRQAQPYRSGDRREVEAYARDFSRCLGDFWATGRFEFACSLIGPPARRGDRLQRLNAARNRLDLCRGLQAREL